MSGTKHSTKAAFSGEVDENGGPPLLCWTDSPQDVVVDNAQAADD